MIDDPCKELQVALIKATRILDLAKAKVLRFTSGEPIDTNEHPLDAIKASFALESAAEALPEQLLS